MQLEQEWEMLFPTGKDHVYGEFVTESTLNNISYEDVIEFHKKYTYPNSAYIVVIGDVNFTK